MKIEIANIETDVKTVKELRQALKDAKDAMVSAEQGTEEYNKALKQTSNIQHELREMQAEINANADDFGQKLGNVSKTLAGVAGGVTAVTGAMSLLGIENEEANKKITATMTSLIGITEGLAKLDDGIKGFSRLTKAIGGSSGALGKFKVALIGTGLGALVVVLGSVIANWEEFTEAIGVSDEMLTSFGDKLQGVFNIFKEGTSRIAQTVGKLLKGDFAGIKEIWSDFSIVESYNKGVEKAVKDRNDAIAVENKKAADEAAAQAKAEADRKAAEAKRLADEALRQRQEQVKKELQAVKDNNQLELNELKQKYVNGIIAEEEYQAELKRLKEEQLNNELDVLSKSLENEQLTEEEKLELKRQYALKQGEILDLQIKNQVKADETVTESTQENAEAQIKWSELSNKQQVDVVNQGVNAMTGMLGDMFEENKGMQIALATIQMLQGIATAISGAFTTKTGPWDIALAAAQATAIGVSGAVNISKIKNTKRTKGGNSSTSASPSINLGALSAASRPIDSVRTVQGASEEAAIKDTRVYVLESDITDTQNRVKTVESESKF